MSILVRFLRLFGYKPRCTALLPLERVSAELFLWDGWSLTACRRCTQREDGHVHHVTIHGYAWRDDSEIDSETELAARRTP